MYLCLISKHSSKFTYSSYSRNFTHRFQYFFTLLSLLSNNINILFGLI